MEDQGRFYCEPVKVFTLSRFGSSLKAELTKKCRKTKKASLSGCLFLLLSV